MEKDLGILNEQFNIEDNYILYIKAGNVFKVAGKDGALGWGNLNGLECKVKKDWRLEDR